MNDEAVLALREIWRICHIPSNGRHAYTHFQSDFDRIRALCKPFLEDTAAGDAVNQSPIT